MVNHGKHGAPDDFFDEAPSTHQASDGTQTNQLVSGRKIELPEIVLEGEQAARSEMGDWVAKDAAAVLGVDADDSFAAPAPRNEAPTQLFDEQPATEPAVELDSLTETLTGTFAAQKTMTSDPRIVAIPRVDTSEPPVPNAGRPAISLVHVSKVYPAQPNKPALDDITLDIYTGEFVFLVGHSGSGKSTFIRLLNRELVATQGQIYVGGENLTTMRNWRIPYLRRNVGCVFQDFKLLPNKTTFENVAFALEVIGKPRAVIKAQVPEVLRLVGLQGKMDAMPDQLSGGEQQRVSIARAMVNRPPYLICDEPTGNLDPQTSLGIMRLLERINRTGTTVVVATHDREMVDSMRRRVIALENGHLVRDQDRGVYGYDV